MVSKISSQRNCTITGYKVSDIHGSINKDGDLPSINPAIRQDKHSEKECGSSFPLCSIYYYKDTVGVWEVKSIGFSVMASCSERVSRLASPSQLQRSDQWRDGEASKSGQM